MPLYTYEAADRTGQKVRSKKEAENEAALREVLREKGLTPLNISLIERREPLGLKRITKKDLLIFTQELGSLLEAGLPIDRAIYVLAEYSGNPQMRAILREVYADLQRGQSLSQALMKHRTFPRLYVNMIRAGELGGILESVIARLASFLETTTAFRDEVVSALVYPVLLTFVGGLAVAVLMIYVVPEFAAIFEDMGQSLPAPTLVLLAVSDWFVSWWWAVLLGTALCILLIRSYAGTDEGRYFIDGIKLKVPIVSGVHMRLVIARFARTLGTLLHSGVPILEAIRVSREVLGNEVVSEKLKAIEEGVGKGRGVSAPLRESGVFPPVVTQMIAVGEEAGRLEDTFILVADKFDAESRATIKRAAGLLEPAMILLMGLVVGFIVISILLAVFSINEIPI